jgi:preprotein translocase subunit SecA
MQLARPGPIWGQYPIRAISKPTGRWISWFEKTNWQDHQARHQAGKVAKKVALTLSRLPTGPHSQTTAQKNGLNARLLKLRRSLRRDGLHGPATRHALTTVAQVAVQTHGLIAYPAQLQSAWLLIHQSLVELPTGEGKSLTAALAAAVLALADVPVHLMTANDYLAQRDAAHFEPFYAALGLRVASTSDSQPSADQQTAFRADITYCTTRTAAFAYLRDIQTKPNNPDRTLLGLCCAIVDEADVALLDEARTPLILAQQINDPQARVRAFQAIAQARELDFKTDYYTDHNRARLTAHGLTRLASAYSNGKGVWLNPQHHQEQIEFALKALHCLQAGRDYVIQEKQIELLDIHSGRIAQGRQLSHGLHDMLAVKEGLPIPKQTVQIASTSYARFFAGYFRLSGLSGTLIDSRSELTRTYRRPVIQVAPHRPSQRKQLPTRTFAQADDLLSALVLQIEELQRSGRPVLVATQDLAQTQWVAKALQAAQLSCQTLGAQDEPAEALIISQAGQVGAITVATQLAGRGTDIHLAQPALDAGGLFVLNLQLNRNRRTDAQVFGRSARQGQPGTVQQWHSASHLNSFVTTLPLAAQSWANALLATPSATRIKLASWLMQQAWEQDDRFARRRSNVSEQNWADRLLFSTVQG